MDDDQIWAAIDAHRLRTAELLEQLSDDQWRHPSLCDGWTVRDVAAHLTLQQIGVGTVLQLATRHPGAIARGMNRMIRESARGRADLPAEQIIAEIRGMVGSRRHNIGVTCQETLIDILVHSQDIAMPLGRRLDVDPQAAAVAATRVWSYSGGSKAKVFRKIPFEGLRFVATDAAWSVGSGREIEGPISAILLVLTGRLAGLSMLSGDGTGALTAS
jgi:uncharacterized protein (TIGR03083 family)